MIGHYLILRCNPEINNRDNIFDFTPWNESAIIKRISLKKKKETELLC